VKRRVKKPRARSTTGARNRRAGLPSEARPKGERRRVEAVPVTDAELRKLRRELERRLRKPDAAAATRPRASRPRPPARWNPEPEDVQKSVAQLVLTIVEFLRKLMERQAIRRMEQKTLTDAEVEAVGLALMQLEKTVRDIGKRFGLKPEDLNLDLGPVKLV
jgi:Gas vesicle protein K